MTEIVKLQSQIGNATREIEKSYKKALKTIEKLKEKINELELSISQKARALTSFVLGYPCKTRASFARGLVKNENRPNQVSLSDYL